MSTRGTIGFIHNGEFKGKFNHWDSYPTGTGLGYQIVKFIKSKPNWKTFKKNYDKIEWTPETEEVKGYVGKKDKNDNDLVLGTDDTLQMIYKGKVKKLVDSSDFPNDSIFNEYTYVLDLDNDIIEFYEGMNKEPQKGNRFGKCPRKCSRKYSRQ